MKFWGFHAVIDARGCDIRAVTNPEKIAEFAKELVKRIDMVPYGEPQVVHFAKHDPEKAGWTLIQLIETSNITAHFLDHNGDAYIDVFSCKPYDIVVVKQVIEEFFNPVGMRVNILTRQA